MISCDCRRLPLDDRMSWTGLWPGFAECREFGWFAKLVPGRIVDVILDPRGGRDGSLPGRLEAGTDLFQLQLHGQGKRVVWHRSVSHAEGWACPSTWSIRQQPIRPSDNS